MKRLSLYVFLVLMFSLFTSHSFAAKKHKIYKKLPCSFNGVKVGPSATPYEDKKIRRHRCAPGSSGYVGKKERQLRQVQISITLNQVESLW